MYLNSLKNLKKPNWVFSQIFQKENLLCLEVLGPLKLEHKFVTLTFKHRNVAKPCGIHCKIQTGCLKKKRFFFADFAMNQNSLSDYSLFTSIKRTFKFSCCFFVNYSDAESDSDSEQYSVKTDLHICKVYIVDQYTGLIQES